MDNREEGESNPGSAERNIRQPQSTQQRANSKLFRCFHDVLSFVFSAFLLLFINHFILIDGGAQDNDAVFLDDWVLLDNMEDIAVGMGLAPANNTEMPTDPVARLAFRKRVLEPQQQQVQVLAHEQLLREQQDQIEACEAHLLELQQIQREPAVTPGPTPTANQGKGKNPALKRKSTARDQQVQQRDDVISSTLAQQALHLEHTMQEELAMMRAGMDRRTVQAKSTRETYARYQSHWTVSVRYFAASALSRLKSPTFSPLTVTL